MSPRATPMAPEERRRAIVEVVVPLLMASGRECTTRQIAEAAGIAEGTIFRAFPDKIALWQAVVEHVVDPQTETRQLKEASARASDLRSLVVSLADHLFARSQRVMTVVGVWRGAILQQYRSGEREMPGSGGKHRPPDFLVDANRALMDGLADLFAVYADELSVAPRTAAATLRTLAIGQRHPGAFEEFLMTPEEIADIMLDGIRRRTHVSEGAA
ncbi:TetR/AcrR family transcriptional regulator [Nocardioides mangrovicus]|uniref:TetR/AcrR family transcriptional regulator n=1 Tax=Nocardioides mangrovicus TaxID=2478913 RepID=UPI0018E09144|nr:TetR/AcrR family transcriptional regulator [Nocardioides mangrovicus]